MKYLLAAVISTVLMAGTASAADLINIDNIWDVNDVSFGAKVTYGSDHIETAVMMPSFAEETLVDVDNFWGDWVNSSDATTVESYSYDYSFDNEFDPVTSAWSWMFEY